MRQATLFRAALSHPAGEKVPECVKLPPNASSGANHCSPGVVGYGEETLVPSHPDPGEHGSAAYRSLRRSLSSRGRCRWQRLTPSFALAPAFRRVRSVPFRWWGERATSSSCEKRYKTHTPQLRFRSVLPLAQTGPVGASFSYIFHVLVSFREGRKERKERTSCVAAEATREACEVHTRTVVPCSVCGRLLTKHRGDDAHSPSGRSFMQKVKNDCAPTLATSPPSSECGGEGAKPGPGKGERWGDGIFKISSSSLCLTLM